MHANAFLFPYDLVPTCVNAWTAHQQGLGQTKSQDDSTRDRDYEFPSEALLREMLAIVYHVSFLAEETRRVAARVAFVPPPPRASSDNTRIGTEPVMNFETPLPFTVHDLLKLAPAIQATDSIIAVCSTEYLRCKKPTTQLAIWGIIHVGSEMCDALRGKRTGFVAPPDYLTISAFSPGTLNVSAGGDALARLRNGQLVDTPLPHLGQGHVGHFLREGADMLYQDACLSLKRKRFHRKLDADQLPKLEYFRTLTRIVQLIQEERHGGTLLIVPTESSLTTGKLKRCLAVKYRVRYPRIWPILVKELTARRQFYDVLFGDGIQWRADNPDVTRDELRCQIRTKGQLDTADEQIGEFTKFVASLAAVDGAVVVSKTLDVLGFGAEILPTSAKLPAIYVAHDPDARSNTRTSSESYGTRHRSAMRICTTAADCLSIVISQDGTIRAIKKVGPAVYVWNDVNLSNFTL